MILTKHKNFSVFFLALLFATAVASGLLGNSPRAYAAVEGEWVNAATIKVDGKDYIDTDFDDSRDYFINGNDGDCKSEVDDFSNGDRSAHFNDRQQDTLNDVCNEKTEDITLKNPGNSQMYFLWVDSAQVEGVFRDSSGANKWAVGMYKRDGDSNRFIHDIEGNCRSSFNAGNDPSKVNLTVRLKLANSCLETQKIEARVGSTENAQKAANTGTGAIAAQAAAEQAAGVSCESVNSGILIGWLICGIINAVDGTVSTLTEAVDNLLNIEESMYDQEGLRVTWAVFKNIATFLLIAVGLVMVISQAIGGGPFDAYTVRKVLPRLLIAVIAIQLSWYLFTAMIEVINVIGWGLQGILYAPWGGRDNFTLNALLSDSVGGAGQGDASGTRLFALAAVGGAAGGVAFLGLAGLLLLALSVLVSLLVGFFTLVFREVLIIVLLVLAPLAIVAWILPNTEKYWKMWWENFLKLLLLYPMILLLIAGGQLVAKITLDANLDNNVAERTLTFIIVVIAIFTPFFLIPKMFQLAGTALASVSGALSKGAAPLQKGIGDVRRRRSAEHREREGRKILQKRADWQNRLQTAASKDRNALSKFMLRQASRGVGGYNVQAADSARRAAVGKEINDQIATGRDDEIRGLTVDKRTAERRVNSDGVVQYKSLGGAWINEAAVDEGHRRWGNDTYAQQAALSYEMRKAMTSDDVRHLSDNYHNTARSWGMSDNQAGGAWIGAAFENQNQHLEYKYTDWKDGTMSRENAAKYATEVYEKRGSYPLAQMGANTIEQLKVAYDVAANEGDFDTQKKIQAIAETFVYRGGASTTQQPGADADQVVQIQAPQAGGQVGQVGSIVQTNTPGAAHVAQAVRELAVHVGVYQEGQDPSTNTKSTGQPPQIPRLN